MSKRRHNADVFHEVSRAVSQAIRVFVWLAAVIIVFILWRWQSGDLWATQMVYKAFSAAVTLALFGFAVAFIAKALRGR